MSTKNLSAQITIGGALSSGFKSMIGNAKAQIGGLGTSLGTLTSRQRELNNVIKQQEKLGINGNANALRVGYAQQELAVIGQQITAIKERNRIMQASAEGRAKGSSMMMGGTIAVGAAVGMAATLGATTRAAAGLEHKLQLIGNTANMTKGEIGNLKDQIFAVSKSTNKSVDSVTEGIGFLIAAGMEVKTAAAMIGTISKASTATGANVEDLAKAAFTLNDSLNIDPEKIKTALNIMAISGKEGNVELRDMVKQLPVLGSGFKSLNIEGTEATATIGAALQIARKGASDADEAANNMKNFIAKIMSPETLKKAQKHFGIDLYAIIKDAQTKGKNPFEESMKAIIKMTKGDQKAIGELFGDMQVQNFLRPMIDQWGEYERIKRKALGGGNPIDDDFNKMMDTMKEKTIGLGNAWTRLLTTLGDQSTPVIGSLATSLTTVVDTLQTFSKENPTTVNAVMGTVGAVVGLTAAVGIGKLAAGAFMYAWSGVPAVLGAAGTALGWVAGTALPAVATALRVVAAAAFGNPVGLLVTGLVAGAVWVATHWETVTKVFNAVGDAIGSAWSKAKGFFGLGSNGPTASSTTAPQAGNVVPFAPPAMRGPGSSVSNVDNSTVNLSINTQPGQDSKAIARSVMEEMDKQRGIKRRSVMFDLAAGH